MSLSGPYGDMYRDPYEQQHIVAEMTGHIERDPTHAQGYFRRGNAFSNLGQYEQAKQGMDKVLALQPDNARAYNNRGIAYLFPTMLQPP